MTVGHSGGRCHWAGTHVAASLLLGACAAPSQIATMQKTEDYLQRFVTAAQEALDCRAAAARGPRYQALNRHMPLADVGSATLPQMLDPAFATSAEVEALAAWTRDANACREPLLQVTDDTLPSFGPIIEASRDADDAVFVKLAQHRLTWGEAVMGLKDNRTKLHASVIDRADQVTAELGRAQQEQLTRRTAILSSVIRILP